MKLEHYSEKKLKRQVNTIVKNHLDIKSYKVFFFGSRVKGDNFERADIDIGIEGVKKIPAHIKLSIKEALDNLPFLYKIDFVDFKDVSDEFRKEALKYTEYVS
jgi:uncharacterized protein